jgi:hypothetical protein
MFMSQVSSSGIKREIVNGKPSQVLGIAQVEWDAVRFTNAQGEVDVCISATFGVDPQTGEEQSVVIEPRVLKDLLTIPHPHIREGIRKARKARKAAAAMPELPDNVGSIGKLELGEVG